MDQSPSNLDEWTARATRALGLEEDVVPVGLLLDVTRDAAHEVTRPAGPVTTYLLGLAVARGRAIDDAVAVVRAEIERWGR